MSKQVFISLGRTMTTLATCRLDLAVVTIHRWVSCNLQSLILITTYTLMYLELDLALHVLGSRGSQGDSE